MSIGSVRYNIGLKCKYAKILLTTKMIQHSKSTQNDVQKRNFKQKTSMLSISATLSGMISHVGLFLLASCETLGRRSQNP